MEGYSADHVLKVDVEELWGVTSLMKSCAQQMEDQRAQPDTMNQVLLEAWSGQAREAYVQAFASWRKSFQKKIVTAQMIAASFDKVADDFTSASQRVRALWSGGRAA